MKIKRIELTGGGGGGADPGDIPQNQLDALAGTNGTPSSSNRYVTNSDPRLQGGGGGGGDLGPGSVEPEHMAWNDEPLGQDGYYLPATAVTEADGFDETWIRVPLLSLLPLFQAPDQGTYVLVATDGEIQWQEVS